MNLREKMNTIAKKNSVDTTLYYVILDYIEEYAERGEFELCTSICRPLVMFIAGKLVADGFTVEVRPELYNNLKISWE